MNINEDIKSVYKESSIIDAEYDKLIFNYKESAHDDYFLEIKEEISTPSGLGVADSASTVVFRANHQLSEYITWAIGFETIPHEGNPKVGALGWDVLRKCQRQGKKTDKE